MDILWIFVINFVIWFSILWFIMEQRSKKLRKETTDELLSKINKEDIIIIYDRANFFGQESRGHIQSLGKGVLVLTVKGIFFSMWMPKREIYIPIISVDRTEIVGSYLGRSRFKSLLKVVYKRDARLKDSIAWLVPKPNFWKMKIDELIHQSSSSVITGM